MKESEIQEITREVHAVERGETLAARVREVTVLPGGVMRRVELDPEIYRQKQANAWNAKTYVAKVRHELDLNQEDFAAMLGVSPATLCKWERGTSEPSGAAKTLLAVARLHPEAIIEALALGS
jgi:DNA-binding transcriptional regulator YiaG